MTAIVANRFYMAKWSIVCSIERAVGINLSNIRAMAIRELNNTGLVRVADGEAQTYIIQHTIDNWIGSDYKQIDFVARFQGVSNGYIGTLDNAYSYYWNTIAGTPMLPS